ncbi:MAG: hypothetical protein HYU64_07690 [Armatimonadetes bacterium]|nr:hypothetical protein [Armatimonadota bacterium]
MGLATNALISNGAMTPFDGLDKALGTLGRKVRILKLNSPPLTLYTVVLYRGDC